MPKFKYSAYSRSDVSQGVTDQVIEAENEHEAGEKVRSLGYVVTDISQVASKATRWNSEIKLFQKAKVKDLASFTRRLATLVQSELPILASLEATINGTSSQVIKTAASNVLQQVTQGVKLSDALEQHPKVFDALYVSLVRAGEASSIGPSLERLATMLEQQAGLRQDVRSALAYPILVTVVVTLVMTAMMLFVIPGFEEVYSTFDAQLPKPTLILMGISSALREFWYIALLTVLGAGLGMRRWLSSETGRLIWDDRILSLPMKLGDLITKVATARFFRTFATLYDSGVKVLPALEISGPTCGNTAMSQWVGRQVKQIEDGVPMSIAFRDGYFPFVAMAFLDAAEKSGDTGKMVTKLAESFESDVAASVKTLKSILEPLLITMIAAVVGVLVIAMYLPMFSLYSQIQ